MSSEKVLEALVSLCWGSCVPPPSDPQGLIERGNPSRVADLVFLNLFSARSCCPQTLFPQMPLSSQHCLCEVSAGSAEARPEQDCLRAGLSNGGLQLLGC